VTAEYAKHDWNVADYHIFSLGPDVIDRQTQKELLLRGPKLKSCKPGDYFVCLGAAQTFGRFCEKPFPTLLQERLQLEVLNIGRGGAGPSFFSKENDQLLKYINNAPFAIIQIMSGRSESNSLYESKGLGYYYRRSDGIGISCDMAFQELFKTHDINFVKEIVAETRTNWIQSYIELLDNIQVPKVLFWFSERYPRYQERYENLGTMYGQFPQLVNQDMVDQIRRHADDYVECLSTKGLPHKLIDRFTGLATTVEDPWAGLWTENRYYPSPEMHLEASEMLENVCSKYVSFDKNNPIKKTKFISKFRNGLWRKTLHLANKFKKN
jgi:hypothetical protein